jgi:hypothetical protein
MSEVQPPERDTPEERLPWQQLIFDDIFLLVAAGLIVPTIFYLIWGLWSLSNIPFFTR